MRAGAAGMRQARAFFRPATVAALLRCRPRFREGRAAPVPPSFARLRGGRSLARLSQLAEGLGILPFSGEGKGLIGLMR